MPLNIVSRLTLFRRVSECPSLTHTLLSFLTRPLTDHPHRRVSLPILILSSSRSTRTDKPVLLRRSLTYHSGPRHNPFLSTPTDDPEVRSLFPFPLPLHSSSDRWLSILPFVPKPECYRSSLQTSRSRKLPSLSARHQLHSSRSESSYPDSIFLPFLSSLTLNLTARNLPSFLRPIPKLASSSKSSTTV